MIKSLTMGVRKLTNFDKHKQLDPIKEGINL